MKKKQLISILLSLAVVVTTCICPTNVSAANTTNTEATLQETKKDQTKNPKCYVLNQNKYQI